MKKICSLFIALMAVIGLSAQNLENGFYLAGTMNGWGAAEGYHFVGNPNNPAEFMLETTLTAGDEFKVINYLDGQTTAWYPGEGGNYVVDAAHAGDVTIYFQPDYKADWADFGGYFYVAVPETPVADEWAEIKFAAAAAADEIDADASFTVDGFTVAITDPDNKMSIDANDCRFGTAEAYTMYNFRIKSGGKSSATKNFITLTIPEAGTLRIAVRTGSNSATDRNLVLKQGDDTLYNQVIAETMAVKVMEGETEVSVYPFVEVPVEAGTVALSYPVNGLNFYAFAFKAAGGETPVVLEAPDAAPAAPTYPANQVHAMYSATYNADCGFGEWGSGTQVTQEEFGKKYVTTQLGYFGMEFPAGVDCSNMEALHLDVWAANDFSLRVVPIHGGTEVGKTVNIEGQKWNAIDIPLTEFVGVENWSNVIQIKIDEARGVTFWLNNVYFYTTQEQFTYTVAGSSAIAFGTTWDPANAANDMVLQQDGTYKWEKTNIELAEGEIAFKVCENHAWTHAWPAQDYKLAIPEGGLYTVTITFNPAAEADKVAAVAQKTGEAVVLPNVILHGNFTGNWADTDPFVAAADRLTASLTLNLAEGTYEFGFKFDGAWKANGANITRDANTANLATGDGNMHITADVAGEYVFVYTFATQELVVTYPVNALTIPEDAPVPTVAEDDVMAIYCNHYANNNANFGISGWAGGYQTLDLNGINVGYWTNMTWECIIDPAHTDDAHDFSAYKNLHVDLWAPLPAKIKFTAEAVAGGNYKDGQVIEMQQGWNSVDFAVAEWPGNYDFANLKCFVFEQYKTLEGESFEGNPFAFANIYFYGKEEQGVENTAVDAKAVKMIENGQLIILKNGVRYNAQGAIVR